MDCWNSKDLIIDEMNRNYPVYKNLMHETEHISVLKNTINQLLNLENKRPLSVIDIGCGTAQISLLFEKLYFEYEGCDLPHVLEHCAHKWHPENIYYPLNAAVSPFAFVKNYDIVLTNAFIDVMESPIEILSKILANATKYVIIHRQEISETKPTHTFLNPSYGGQTHHSIINKNDFETLIKNYGFEIILNQKCGFSNWENNGDSFLLKKIN